MNIPYHALIVYQVENIFSNLKLAVLWEILFEVPAPAPVKYSDKQRTEKVDNQNGDCSEHLLKQLQS